MAIITAERPVKTPLWWALAALCGLLLVVQLLVSSIFVFGDKSAAINAKNNAQRVWLSPQQSKQTMPAGAPELPATLPPKDAKASKADLMAEFAGQDSQKEPLQTTNGAQEPSVVTKLPPAKPAADRFAGAQNDVLDAIPAEPRTTASLAAPKDALLEPWTDGALPMREGNETPFDVYSRPFPVHSVKKPFIALLITDLGAVRNSAELATQLPADVTLAFNPYARHSSAWMQTARNRGIESWLILPAQPDGFPASDGGPGTLLVEQPADESLLRLKQTMAKMLGYSGLVLPVGEAYSDHLGALRWLNTQLESRGLGLIAAQRPNNSASRGWFKRELKTYSSNILIDDKLSMKAIEKQLAALETHATQHGYAMGTIRPYPLSMKMIQPWLKSLEAKGILLAPASAVVRASVK